MCQLEFRKLSAAVYLAYFWSFGSWFFGLVGLYVGGLGVGGSVGNWASGLVGLWVGRCVVCWVCQLLSVTYEQSMTKCEQCSTLGDQIMPALCEV